MNAIRGGNFKYNLKTKHIVSRKWAVIGLAALTASLALQALADDSAATAPLPHKSCTGTIVSVNNDQHALELRGLIFSKKFTLGSPCEFVLWNKTEGTPADLKPGEKVMVVYQESQGVRVASRVAEQPARGEGMIKTIDPAQRTLTLHSGSFDRNYQLPEDCAIVLRGDKKGALADLQPGNHVTIIYETPGDKATARQIAQTSATFTGSLTAIDLEARTVKAKTMLATKKFTVGDDCAIVVNGKPDGKLSDLRPDQRLVFSYNDINGVNIVDRIAPAQTTQAPEAPVARQVME